MKPTDPQLKQRFLVLVGKVRGAEPRPMFGQVGAMIHDHMFAGTFEDLIVLRLSEPERALFARAFGAEPFEPMPGRAMKEYLAAPASTMPDDVTLLAWMKRAAAYAATLPPKKSAGGTRAAPAKRQPAAKAAAPKAKPAARKKAGKKRGPAGKKPR